jgi:hypothetical protein
VPQANTDAVLIRTCHAAIAARAACLDLAKGRDWDRLRPSEGKRLDAFLDGMRGNIDEVIRMGAATLAGAKAKASVVLMIENACLDGEGDGALAASLARDILRIA